MRNYIYRFGIITIFLLALAAPTFGEPGNILTIKGAVKQELHLSADDLKQFQLSEVQLNEILKDGTFRGVFKYRGVPLKTLLELAGIQKKSADFNKPVDLAVLVKDAAGKRIALSWGEIFYRNPDHVIVAVSAVPIIPHKHGNMKFFPDKKAYKQMMDALGRDIGFPKLVVSGDLYTDRSLENIVEIEVKDLKSEVSGKKGDALYAEKFLVTGNVKFFFTIDRLPNLPRKQITTHVVGEGRGYHGTETFGGISFTDILKEAMPDLGLNTIFVISGPDGYSASLSYGELYLNPHGERILIADSIDEKPIEKFGQFILTLPDDLMADREVKAVSKIEVIVVK